MHPIMIGREIAAVWALMASYPLECLTALQPPLRFNNSQDAVILVHGNGGDRTNMLAMSIFARMVGFENIGFFSYPTRQSVEVSATQLAAMATEAEGSAGVHFIGHSLGGTIARSAAALLEDGRTRSLVTLASPYSDAQESPLEVAIFGTDDPIVQAPSGESFPAHMFKRLIVLRNTGHLGILFHDEAIRITLTELAANQRAVQ
jgi:pimeloyl-ACP methyl ester carboxylesterase